MNNRES